MRTVHVQPILPNPTSTTIVWAMQDCVLLPFKKIYHYSSHWQLNSLVQFSVFLTLTDQAVDVNNRYSINGSQLQDMYVLDEEANFNPQRLDPISTSFFERNVLGDGSGGTFFTNPAASLPGNTAYAESPQPINYSS